MLKKFIILLSIFAIGSTSGVQHRHHKHHNAITTTVTKHHTVTKTVNKPCNTGIDIGTGITDEPTPTIEPQETTTTVVEGGNDSVANCLAIFNKFRASQNLSPLQSATQSEIDCAHQAAAYDTRMGYHSSFYSRMCPYARAQCECMPGVNGGGLENCINAYISEGPPGTVGQFPGENHGHWNIIVGDFTHVACGTDGNGFYTHNFY
jgi:hypothetical protein